MEFTEAHNNSLLKVYSRQHERSNYLKPLETEKHLHENVSTTSLKHSEITNSPMCYKTIDKIPGIGKATQENMNKLGIIFAYQLMGKYFLNECHGDNFKSFLQEFKINDRYQRTITSSMEDYKFQFEIKTNLPNQLIGSWLFSKMNVDETKKLLRKNYGMVSEDNIETTIKDLCNYTNLFIGISL
jgi:hypothetical protein